MFLEVLFRGIRLLVARSGTELSRLAILNSAGSVFRSTQLEVLLLRGRLEQLASRLAARRICGWLPCWMSPIARLPADCATGCRLRQEKEPQNETFSSALFKDLSCSRHHLRKSSRAEPKAASSPASRDFLEVGFLLFLCILNSRLLSKARNSSLRTQH